MTSTRSVGQAKFFSKTSQTIESKGTSIVRRLAWRRITGTGLRIQIHQHIGFKLHLVWHVTDNNNYKSLRCSKRVLSEYGSLLDFCTPLKNGAFEGLLIVYILISSSGWKKKLNPVFWNIPHNYILDNSFSYDPGNVQNRYKTEERLLSMYVPSVDFLRSRRLYME